MNTIKNIQLSKILEESLEIYKKNILIIGLAFLFLTFVLVVIYSMALQTFYKGNNILEDIKKIENANIDYLPKQIFYIIIASVSVLTAPFTAGILRMMQQTDKEGKTSFGTLFCYVNSSLFYKIIGSSFLIAVFTYAYTNGVDYFFHKNLISQVLSPVISLSTTVFTFTLMPNIIFLNNSIKESFLKSIAECKRNFFTILLLIIIGTFVGYLGLFAFCVGIFFSFPFYFSIQYATFKHLNEVPVSFFEEIKEDE